MKMAYNDFAKKFAKLINKSYNFIIERKDDDVYIVYDGVVMVKVNITLYNLAFRPESALFVELNEDTAFSRRRQNMVMPEKDPGAPNLAQLWDSMASVSTEPLCVSPYAADFKYHGKNERTRLIHNENGDIVWIREEYYQLCNILEHNEVKGKGSYSAVIFTDGMFDIDIIVMPVKRDVYRIKDLFPNRESENVAE